LPQVSLLPVRIFVFIISADGANGKRNFASTSRRAVRQTGFFSAFPRKRRKLEEKLVEITEEIGYNKIV